HMAADERMLLEDATRWAPAFAQLQPYAPDVLLGGDETLELAGITFQTLRVPGHSPAHLAYYAAGCLFSGDVLFAGSVGRTDLPGASWDRLVESIRTLADRFPPETIVYSGHGPETTLGAELARNPFPAEQPLWRWVMREMEEVCAHYGYRRIDTPGIEDTELIIRTSGSGSDIVQKETYTFVDRGGRSLTLRPEATAPICRAYLQHGLHREPQPQKLYTIGPMWRYDRPQRGRYREHWQLSVEGIGTDDPAIDAEV